MIALHGVELVRDGFTLSVDLTLEAGQRLAVIGASGAGKSTLLDVIAGFQRPTHGRVLIDGVDVTGAGVAARPLSILFQDGNLFPHLRVFDNVALGLDPDLRLSAGDRARVEDVLAQVGLAGFGPRRPAELSGGQAARVALARLLLRDKPVALMDEPFAALDPGLRRDMAELVGKLAAARAMTLVIVAHDLRGLDALATHLALIEGGRIAVLDRMKTLRTSPPKELRPWL